MHAPLLDDLTPVVQNADHVQALLAAIVASSDDAIVSKTLEGIITSWNDAAHRLFGYTADEAIGQPITLIIPSDRLHEEHDIISRVRRGERIEHLETVRVTKDGRFINLRLSVSPVRDRDGRVIGASKVARDITEEKRIAEALRRSEQRYRSLTHATASIVWSTDAQGHVVEYLPDWEAYTGLPWEQHRGDGWAQSLHPEDRARILDTWQHALASRSEYRVEGRVWHAPSHAYRHFEARGVPILAENGDVVEWVGTYVDTHDRKVAEQALADNRRQFEQLLALLPTGVFSCAADGTIDYFNEKAVELWGKRPHPGQTHRDFVLPILHQADGRPFDYPSTPMAQVLRDGRTFRNRELLLNRPDGTHITVLSNIDPLRDAAGQITGGVCAFIDSTDLKKTQEALRKLNEELESRVAERTNIAESRARQLRALARELTLAEQQERQRIAALLHDDLVQLLAVSKIQLNLLARRIAESPNAAAAESIASLEELIDESIRFTRTLMSDLTPPTLNKGNLGSAVRWVAEKLQKHALHVEVAEDEPVTDIEEDVVVVLFQSVRELLFNVVKHAGVNHAEVRLRRRDGRIEVAVADRGKGFDSTVPREPSSAGGFGLFHLRERLDMLGGGIDIASAPGQGTRITLFVPCERGATLHAAHPHAHPRHADKSRQNPDARPIRVLLVDDHAMVREGLRHVMQQYPDIEIVGEADDGEAAIEQARRLKPDVVLMDVNLPRMNGQDATRRILQDSPRIHVVALSIHNDDQIISAMRDAGAAAYLTKAEASNSLHATIRSLMLAE